ncbi:MAG: NirA family protein [Burkholderiaceae bacterium]
MDASSVEPLSTAQKEYLQGFTAGLAASGLIGQAQPVSQAASSEVWFGTPIEDLCREERLKIEEDPFAMWDKMLRYASSDTPPEAGDVFRYKYHGLFYVAPAQDSFMVRVRVPANVLSAAQLRALAAIARDLGGGHCDITTRGNIQIREIAPRSSVEVLMRLSECGLSSRGAGADNVRNVTASPGAGFDPHELIDTRPMARAMQFYLNNNRDLFGLPRKFNIAFDGAGRFSNVAATNDIAFTASRLKSVADAPVEFRLALAGITGHLRFAVESGIAVALEDAVPLAGAILRVFAAHGDRTDRTKARLCYVLDRLGLEHFLELTEAQFGRPLKRIRAEDYLERPAVDKRAHLGIHAQRQPGRYYVGLAIPVGRLTVAQMEDLSSLAERFSAGELRLTVWQNALLPNVAEGDLEELSARLKELRFAPVEGRMDPHIVACTGNTGCRFAASDTKGHALALGAALNQKFELDTPINIHLTGCPHSCAQHYVADIGLLGAQVAAADGTTIEGYHVYVGGGCENEQGLGRELVRNVPVADLFDVLSAVIEHYLGARSKQESFVAYCARQDIDALRHCLQLAPLIA